MGKLSILDNYRVNKINRLNITKDMFLSQYQKDPINALGKLFQQSVLENDLKRLYRMLGDEQIGLIYDTFAFTKKERFLRFLTMPIKTRYELEKNWFIREQMKIQNNYMDEEDVKDSDIQQFDSFSIRNHSDKTVTVSRLIRDTTLAKKLKFLYDHQCQVCNQQLESSNGFISEAHHIQPYNKSHKGDDTWGNMIVLCPNCHAQFDNLYFAIEPTKQKLYCLNERNPYNGKKIITKEGHKLKECYLEYTWAKFLEIKSLLID